MEKQDIHAGWLHLDQLMSNKPQWAFCRQAAQSAFYMGAISVLKSRQNRKHLWRQCESGISDAVKEPVNLDSFYGKES